MSSGVSIIICCYNSSTRINSTLNHLQEQHFLNSINWEVIIVDNASTDNTSEVARECWKKKPVTDFKIVLQEIPGLMNARIKGITCAKYDIVSFIDDDNWVEKNWVEKVFEVFNSDLKIGACGGFNEVIFENIKPDWFEDYQNCFAVGKQLHNSGYIDDKNGFLWGAGLSIRKSIWVELSNRKFKNLTIDRNKNNLSAGGDTELCYAFRLLGYNLYYKEDLHLKHYMSDDRMSFSYLEKLFTGFGKANVRLNCYRVLLDPEKFKIRSWWYEWIASLKSIIKNLAIILFTSDNSKREKARTARAYWKGYAFQTWNDKKQVQNNIATLRNVFTSF